jgi:oxygen-independent coproporphyrinogen-3 oxidase
LKKDPDECRFPRIAATVLTFPGPRYTSYPTADRFVEAFGADDYIQALEQRRTGRLAMAMPLSLYVHMPFCESLCYYCACNKIITKHHEPR